MTVSAVETFQKFPAFHAPAPRPFHHHGPCGCPAPRCDGPQSSGRPGPFLRGWAFGQGRGKWGCEQTSGVDNGADPTLTSGRVTLFPSCLPSPWLKNDRIGTCASSHPGPGGRPRGWTAAPPSARVPTPRNEPWGGVLCRPDSGSGQSSIHPPGRSNSRPTPIDEASGDVPRFRFRRSLFCF